MNRDMDSSECWFGSTRLAWPENLENPPTWLRNRSNLTIWRSVLSDGETTFAKVSAIQRHGSTAA